MSPITAPRRVLELSDEEGAAAFCCKVFVRAGVEVIRVESPDRDAPREAANRFLNGGKRRVTLDLDSEAGRSDLDRLAASCDVFVTDWAARDVERLELMHAGGEAGPALRISITPFGLSGPRRDWQATPSMLLAMGGHTWLAGDEGRAPLTMPWPYPQYQSGHFAYIAAMAYLASTEGAGAPRTIEVSMLETLTSLHQFTDTMWTHGGRLRSRHGNRFENTTNLLLQCPDGWYEVSLPQNFWVQFSHMIGRGDLAEGSPFSSAAGRLEHHEAFGEMIDEAIGDWPVERIMREGQEVWRVPMGYAAGIGELLDDAHLAHNDFWQPVPGEESVQFPTPPVHISGLAALAEQPVVAPGADTDAVLAELPSGAEAVDAPFSLAAPADEPPLRGVRILDLTRVWAGPVATRILADLGAEVIHVSAPMGRGPQVVQGGPGVDFPEGGPGDRPWNRQALFNKLHRNKRSLAVDLKTEQGRQIFLDLVATADVVIENFSPRVMPGLGLGYDVLSKANPQIIYVAMPAYGLAGPRRDYIGFGSSIEPTSGFSALLGYSADEPRITAAGISDPIAGTTAVAAILTALARRAEGGAGGEGALLELAQQQAGINFLGEFFVQRQLTGRDPERIGNAHPTYAPHGVYRCAGDDEWIAFATRNEDEWTALAGAAERGWAGEWRYAGLAARQANRADLDAAIEQWTVGYDKYELTELLQAAGVAAGPVQPAPGWLTDEQLEARGYFVELEHPDAGLGRWDGTPIVVDGQRDHGWWTAAAGLGADNEAILRDLGRSDAEIAALQADGIVVDRPPR
ncbi:MAG TPA: CoA transferase [Dehalococcoidia bacterium]|nr:CoA transferase [Dehalococcoidia bacterium]